MRAPLWIASGAGIVAALCGLWLFGRAGVHSTEKGLSSTGGIPLLPGESLRTDWPPEEVFRRAFWRHPRKGDRILHAGRFESSGSDGVSRWVWFMKIHPSAELMQDLRNPSIFGLLATQEPRPFLPGDIALPAWYPELNKDAGAEILQHPSQSFTIRYHTQGNLLYASDHGEGFAKSVSD